MNKNQQHTVAQPSVLSFDGHIEWLSADEFLRSHDWWNIYLQSFPPQEQDTKQQILLALQKNIGQIGCYRIQNTIAAIFVIYHLQTPSFTFLHYFAVAQAWRNKKLGSKLFLMVKHEAAEKLTDMIWEVEDPQAAVTEVDKEIRVKRISFYERLGGQLLKTKFIQPALNNNSPVAMRLMQHSSAAVPSEQAIITAIYHQKYRAINGTDLKQITQLMKLC